MEEQTPEFVLRPVRESDLPQLVKLVEANPDPLTTLPKEKAFLERKIHESLRAFYPKVSQPGAEHYLFVLEEARTERLVGTSGIIARVGGFEPFYTYELKKESLAYPPLQIESHQPVLHLKKSHKGPSELCSLYLDPAYRRYGLGRLLSFSRFLFMHAFPKRFEEECIAELRGFLDPHGHSPFWEAVGKKFFQHEFDTADVLSGLGDKEFIEALMPKHPIYVALLPEAAQRVIGQVHKDTEAALRLLRQQGFKATDEVDIFDAGPLVRARTKGILAIRETRSFRAQREASTSERRQNALISGTDLEFRVTRDRVRIDGEDVHLSPGALERLGLEPGAPVLCLPVHRPVSENPESQQAQS